MTKPVGVRASEIMLNGKKHVLLSFPRGDDPLAKLTAAERQVAIAILAGYSNLEIARMRGSAPRTVANQIAAMFKKLGVRSRSELAARSPLAAR